MKYHARLEYGSKSHYFYNHDEDSIIEKVVVPFVNGQVVPIKGERLFNMKTATFLKVYRTKNFLKAKKDQSVVEQIRDPSFEDNECSSDIFGKAQDRGAYKALSSMIQKALQPPADQVFIVMKFGDASLDSAYEGVYKPIVEEFGLECVRIDEIEDSGKISDQILEKIAESKYVICDLTGSRPNCYYETGFAHALGKEVILLANKSETIHFDLQAHRFIQWTTEDDLRKKLRKRLSSLEAERNREE